MTLRGYLEKRVRMVNRALEQFVSAEPPHAGKLVDAMRYALFAGGKRIRPILLIASAEAVGGKAQDVLPCACAIEMIHTYSLVHDDLPAMDDDELRRGKPATHVAYGESTAILAGDALLTDAFCVMARSVDRGINPRRLLAVISEIAEAAGSRGMVAGQMLDIEAEGKAASLPMVERIHMRKTGALILAAVRAGAILGGARPAQLQVLSRYGEFLGLAFQVADDILDAEGSTELTGKEQGRDEARQKATFPSVLGLSAARQRAQELLHQAIAELDGFPRSADPLRQIAKFIVARAVGPPPQRRKRRANRQ